MCVGVSVKSTVRVWTQYPHHTPLVLPTGTLMCGYVLSPFEFTILDYFMHVNG